MNILNVNNFHRALLLCFLFSLAFSILGLQLMRGGDFGFHLEKAEYGCSGFPSADAVRRCEIYTPLFHWLAGPFTFHDNAFSYFALFLIGIATPLAVFFVSKRWESVFLYFTVSSYFWFFVDGIYPQALAGLFLLLIIVFDSLAWRLTFLLLLILAHSHGFLLGLLALVCLMLPRVFDFKQLAFLSCSGVYGGNPRPEILTHRLGWVSGGEWLNVADILHFVTRIFPLPFMIMAVYYSWVKKYRPDLLLLGFGLIVGGLFVSPRIFYFVFLAWLPALAEFASELKDGGRFIFFIGVILTFGFQLFAFFNFKICILG